MEINKTIFVKYCYYLCYIQFFFLTGSTLIAQPTFTVTFTPNTIGPGSVTTIEYVITNNSASPMTNLAFNNTLPVGVTIADPANASHDCNTGTLTAPDGGSTITFSGGGVGAFSTCRIRVDVTSSTVGMHTNPAITLSSSAGNSMSVMEDLTVTNDRPGFTKSFAPSSLDVGERSTLTFTIDNSANASDLSSLVFTDNLPPGMVIASPANASSTCGGPNPMLTATEGGNEVSFSSFGILFPGFEVMLAGETCVITVDVIAESNGMLDNISGELSSNVGSSGKASATLDVSVTPLAIRKSFTDDPVPPGGTVTMDITITNFDRNFSATGIAFTDDLNATLAGLTFSSLISNDCGMGSNVTGVGTNTIGLTGGTLPTGGSCTISASLTVPPGAVPGAYTNTTGTVTATLNGSPVVGNMASEDLFISPAPIITKTFKTNPALPGDAVELEFTITNTSSTSSATDISVQDLFPTFLATAGVTPGDGCCGAGSTCTFTPLFNPPPPSDVIPATLSISGGTLAPAGMPGDACTFSITLDLAATAPPGIIENKTTDITATVDGETRTGAPAIDSLTILSAPQLIKSFTDDPVAPGGTATLEFTLTHHADAAGAATDITFTDDLNAALAGMTVNLPSTPDPPCGAGSSLIASAGGTFLTLMDGNLLPGGACTFSVTVDIPANAPSGDHTNTTSGVSAMVDGRSVTSAASRDDLKVTGLNFTKEFIGDPVLPGEMVTLRFTLENISPTDDVSSISFNDDLSFVLPGVPDLTAVTTLPLAACGGTLSSLGSGFLIFAGGSLLQGDPPCSFDLVLQVPTGIDDGIYTNTTSSLTAVIGGSLVVLDNATAGLEVENTLIDLTKEFIDDPLAPGDAGTLRFTLTNLDPARNASAIAFTDNIGALIPGLVATGLPSSACGGTVEANPDAGTIAFSGGSLGPGGQCQFDVSFTVPGAAMAGTFPNMTSPVSGTIDGLAVDGTPASDDLVVSGMPIAFSKSFDGPTTATGTAVLTFTLTNPNSDPVSGIGFMDDLNNVISGLTATNLPLVDVCGTGSVVSGTNVISLAGGTLAPMGGMCSFNVEVLVPAGASAGSFLNTTTNLTSSGLDVAEPATATLVIEPPPTFAKVFAPDVIGINQNSTLTFTIDNSASALAASNLDFMDNLPAGLVVANPSNASTTCTGGMLTADMGTGVITYTGGTVGAGASCTVQVDVTSTASGMLNNTSGALTSTSGNSGTASDALTVDPPPTFAKSFAPDMGLQGTVSTLTFTINNSASTVAANGLNFTDNLPAGMIVANPSNASTTCMGGMVTADAGTSVITYTGGSIAAGATCMVTVDVTTNAPGDLMNNSGNLGSSLGNSGTASDTYKSIPLPDANLYDTDGDMIPDITDPCSCEDPENVLIGDRVDLFHDVVTITNGGIGETWRLEVVFSGGFLKKDGTPYDAGLSTATPPGQILTPLGGGLYQLDFWHKADVGFSVRFIRDSDGFTRTLSSSCSAAACIREVIPTLSQWGLIIFGLLILSLSLILIFRMEAQLAGNHPNQTTNYSIPFDRKIFLEVLHQYSIPILTSAIVIIHLVWGRVTLTDIPGLCISLPIILYIFHLVKMVIPKGNQNSS